MYTPQVRARFNSTNSIELVWDEFDMSILTRPPSPRGVGRELAFEQLVPACEHPDYKRYFEMKATGDISDVVIGIKMERAGLDSERLATPHVRGI